MSKKIISLIGGSGFIGTRLTKKLLSNNNYFVHILDKNPSNAYPDFVKLTDVRDISMLNNNISDNSIIINLAAEHKDDVSPKTLYYDVNVNGAINICEIARGKNVNKIIFLSTVAVYGYAEIGVSESGLINPFNDYGKSKYEAEKVFIEWQSENPTQRTLTIIRPTVVFGEQNRGNVYNLLRQIHTGIFIMIGKGENRKSLAYVENVAAFIEHALDFSSGVHIYNYIDKPDFKMIAFVKYVNKLLGKKNPFIFSVPFIFGYIVGMCFDLVAKLSDKRFSISAVRVQKFCSNSVYNTSIDNTGFVAPVPLEVGLERTIRYEFLESNENQTVFYTE